MLLLQKLETKSKENETADISSYRFSMSHHS